MKLNRQIILTLAAVAAAGWAMASAIPNPEIGGGTNLAYINKTSKTPPTNLPALLKSAQAAQATNAAAARKPETPAAASEPAAMKPADSDDFKAFQIVMDRNIFDKTRTGAPLRRQAVHHPKIDDFTLVGTMSYEKATVAFFDGSSSEYRKNLEVKPDAIIAGYKLMKIGTDYADLQATNGKVVKMPVGTTMRREDNGPWSGPSERADAIASDSGSRSRSRDSGGSSERRSSRRDRGTSSGDASDSTATTTGPSTSSSSTAGGSTDDIVKRLMEKRAKEKGDQ